MKKMLIKINSIEELICPFEGYILGVNHFSICFGKTFNLDEIKKIRLDNMDKKVFVSLNRVIFESELDEYKRVLSKLDDMLLDGIIVGDIAALTYNLKTNIILDQMHLNNSYLTVNHYLNNGVSGIVLTNDITIDDINIIKKENPDAILFKQVFGLCHLSTSKRSLVSNYLKYFNKIKMNDTYIIKENTSDDFYYIKEDYFGTHILNGKPLNLLKEKEKINSDYFIFDSYLLDDCHDAIDAFLKNDTKKHEIINEKYNATDGFINKKTIYKVKNYD